MQTEVVKIAGRTRIKLAVVFDARDVQVARCFSVRVAMKPIAGGTVQKQKRRDVKKTWNVPMPSARS